MAIGKSVKATLRFYNEFRKQAVARGEAVASQLRDVLDNGERPHGCKQTG